MGSGAIFVSHMAEILIPTILIYAITYTGAKNTWKLKGGPLVVFGLLIVTILVAGLINAILYVPLNTSIYGLISVIAIPLIVSLAVIYFLAPRRNK